MLLFGSSHIDNGGINSFSLMGEQDERTRAGLEFGFCDSFVPPLATPSMPHALRSLWQPKLHAGRFFGLPLILIVEGHTGAY